MKNAFVFIFALLALLFASCEALPFDYSRSQSWFIPKSAFYAHNGGKLLRGSICIAAVKVDRTGGWDSIEKEFAALAPLYFWEQGCRVVPDGEDADYTAEIQAREREYNSGWRTRRSLAVEVRLWKREADAAADPAVSRLPLAAGRVIAIGERSLSSSDTAGNMLAQAVKKAVKKLPAAPKEI
jgi:hypothetical protein